MNIAIVSAWDAGMAAIADLTWPNKVAYCERHGYKAVRVRNPTGGYWAKFQGLLDTLQKFDWVFLLDVDTVIMDMETRLEEIIELADSGTALIFTHDAHGMNMGVSFWENCPWSVWFAQKVWERPFGLRDSPHEQDVISKHLYSEPKDLWACFNQRVCNSYLYGLYPDLFPQGFPEGEYQAGDFLIHLAGVTNPERLRIIPDLLESVR